MKYFVSREGSTELIEFSKKSTAVEYCSALKEYEYCIISDDDRRDFYSHYTIIKNQKQAGTGGGK